MKATVKVCGKRKDTPLLQSQRPRSVEAPLLLVPICRGLGGDGRPSCWHTPNLSGISRTQTRSYMGIKTFASLLIIVPTSKRARLMAFVSMTIAGPLASCQVR